MTTGRRDLSRGYLHALCHGFGRGLGISLTIFPWRKAGAGACTLGAGWMQPQFRRLKKCSPIEESQVKLFIRLPQALLSLLPA